MLIELNRFFTTEEVRRQYRVPAAVADDILPNLPVFVTQEDGTRFHLESEVDDFLAELSHNRRKTDILNSPKQNGTSTHANKLTYGPIEVNKTESEATVYGKTYPRDIVQLEVLACLVASKGQWITRAEMKGRSLILKDEEHLERIIKALKKTVQSLSPLIVSSSHGYKLLLPDKVG